MPYWIDPLYNCITGENSTRESKCRHFHHTLQLPIFVIASLHRNLLYPVSMVGVETNNGESSSHRSRLRHRVFSFTMR